MEGLQKLCAPPPPTSAPFLLLCDGIGADLRWRREGKERSRGAHLHLITPQLLARYKTLCGATETPDSHTERDTEARTRRISISLSFKLGATNRGHQKLPLFVSTIDWELILSSYHHQELFFFNKGSFY